MTRLKAIFDLFLLYFCLIIGTEFQGQSKKLFKEKKIVYRQKIGSNKSNFAENSIFIIKKKLYLLLRSKLSKDWVKYLPIVVQSYNETPLKKLGFLKPNDIRSEFDSIIVDIKKKEKKIPVYKEPNVAIQLQNQQKHETDKTKLQVGDYVYVNFNEKLFDKSFDVQVKPKSKKATCSKNRFFLYIKTVKKYFSFCVSEKLSFIKKEEKFINKNIRSTIFTIFHFLTKK
jgi:hypothetical protein